MALDRCVMVLKAGFFICKIEILKITILKSYPPWTAYGTRSFAKTDSLLSCGVVIIPNLQMILSTEKLRILPMDTQPAWREAGTETGGC